MKNQILGLAIIILSLSFADVSYSQFSSTQVFRATPQMISPIYFATLEEDDLYIRVTARRGRCYYYATQGIFSLKDCRTEIDETEASACDAGEDISYQFLGPGLFPTNPGVVIFKPVNLVVKSLYEFEGSKPSGYQIGNFNIFRVDLCGHKP